MAYLDMASILLQYIGVVEGRHLHVLVDQLGELLEPESRRAHNPCNIGTGQRHDQGANPPQV